MTYTERGVKDFKQASLHVIVQYRTPKSLLDFIASYLGHQLLPHPLVQRERALIECVQHDSQGEWLGSPRRSL